MPTTPHPTTDPRDTAVLERRGSARIHTVPVPPPEPPLEPTPGSTRTLEPLDPSQQRARRADPPTLPIALAATLLALALSGPSALREVAQGDDWAYRIAVQRCLEGQGFVDLGWGDPTLLFHILWGSGFSLVFGEGYGPLRISTLLWIPLLAVAGYSILRRCGLGSLSAACGTSLLVFNPIALPLAGSFNTDFPFFALGILGTWMALRAYDQPTVSRALLFGFVAAIAFLTRQPGVVLGLAGSLLLATRGRTGVRAGVIALLPMAGAILLAAAIVPRVVGWEGLSNAPGNSFQPDLVLGHLFHSLSQVLAGGLTIAFFATPLLAGSLAKPRWIPLGIGLVLAGALTLLVHTLWVDTGAPRLQHFPFQGNYFSRAVTGAVSGMTTPVAWPWLWQTLTYVLPGIVALLLVRTVDVGLRWVRRKESNITSDFRVRKNSNITPDFRDRKNSVSQPAAKTDTREPGRDGRSTETTSALIVTGLALALFLPMLLADSFYDRYLLALLLPALVWAGRVPSHDQTKSRFRSSAILVGTLVFAFFTWEWNRAQADRLEAHWKAAEALLAEGYEPEAVSARFEWEGHHLYARALEELDLSIPIDMEGPRPWAALQDRRVTVWEEPYKPADRPVLAVYHPFFSRSLRYISVRGRS